MALKKKKFNKNYRRWNDYFAPSEKDGIRLSPTLTVAPDSGSLKNGNVLYIGDRLADVQIIPNLKSGYPDASLVITDKNYHVYKNTRDALAEDYRIVLIDLVEPRNSMKYNPLTIAESEIEFTSLARSIVKNSDDSPVNKDYEIFFLASFMALVGNHGKKFHLGSNLRDVKVLLNLYLDDENQVIRFFDILETKGWYKDEDGNIFEGRPTDANIEYHMPSGDEGCIRLYRKATSLDISEEIKTECVKQIVSELSKFLNAPFNEILRADDADLSRMWVEKTAVYIEVPEEPDDVTSMLVMMIYSQVIDHADQLVRKHAYSSLAHIHLFIEGLEDHFYLPRIKAKLKTTKAAQVTYTLAIQNMSIFQNKYDEKADFVIDSCATVLYDSSEDNVTLKWVAKKCGTVPPLFSFMNKTDIPLVKPDDLKKLDKNEVIILAGKEPPYIETALSPSEKATKGEIAVVDNKKKKKGRR